VVWPESLEWFWPIHGADVRWLIASFSLRPITYFGNGTGLMRAKPEVQSRYCTLSYKLVVDWLLSSGGRGGRVHDEHTEAENGKSREPSVGLPTQRKPGGPERRLAAAGPEFRKSVSVVAVAGWCL
jgi:hypothetical protein